MYKRFWVWIMIFHGAGSEGFIYSLVHLATIPLFASNNYQEFILFHNLYLWLIYEFCDYSCHNFDLSVKYNCLINFWTNRQIHCWADICYFHFELVWKRVFFLLWIKKQQLIYIHPPIIIKINRFPYYIIS